MKTSNKSVKQRHRESDKGRNERRLEMRKKGNNKFIKEKN
jgi:hypothetical protein